MFIELVDALRCPVSHEESWLVASTARMVFRHIVDGTLGCPVCHAQYPVRRGVVDFRGAAPVPLAAERPSDEMQAMRLAAFLDLTDASGFAVLAGEWGNHAALLRGLVETPLLLVDPPEGIEGEPGISVVRCDGELPLATGSARGVAIDEARDARLASAVRVTKPGGRIVAPADAAMPAGVTALARDDRVWVAEREAATSPLVRLHVRRGS
jgi:uncharacterized protein YbaR (Trm112 family)